MSPEEKIDALRACLDLLCPILEVLDAVNEQDEIISEIRWDIIDIQADINEYIRSLK